MDPNAALLIIRDHTVDLADRINVPQTHATITLRPVGNSDGE